MSAQWAVVSRLHGAGREAASDWLEKNFTHIGRRSTVRWKTRCRDDEDINAGHSGNLTALALLMYWRTAASACC
jgi:hypothetical protein